MVHPPSGIFRRNGPKEKNLAVTFFPFLYEEEITFCDVFSKIFHIIKYRVVYHKIPGSLRTGIDNNFVVITLFDPCPRHLSIETLLWKSTHKLGFPWKICLHPKPNISLDLPMSPPR